MIATAGGAGIEAALTYAAATGQGPAFAQIRQALETARLTRQPPWQTLGQLGTELGVTELTELAASITLAGTEGAKVRASLAAKSAAMRARQLAEAEAGAQAATERMSPAPGRPVRRVPAADRVPGRRPRHQRHLEQKGGQPMPALLELLRAAACVLRARLAAARSTRDAGYTTETVVVTALLVALAIAAIAIIVAKVIGQGQRPQPRMTRGAPQRRGGPGPGQVAAGAGAPPPRQAGSTSGAPRPGPRGEQAGSFPGRRGVFGAAPAVTAGPAAPRSSSRCRC